MARYALLLRAVNVAGSGVVRTDEVSALLGRLGLRSVRAVLASGNFVADSTTRSPAALERTVEETLHQKLGLRTVALVRSAEEWAARTEANPFPEEARKDPGRLTMLLTKRPPGPPAWKELTGWTGGPERIRPGAQDGYVYFAAGIGRSRLTSAVLERTLGTPVTLRNWNTVLRIGALLSSAGPTARRATRSTPTTK